MTTLHLIETVSTMFTRLAVITSEMFTITAILWLLNFAGDIIRKFVQFTIAMYVFGQMCGEFYYTHLHDYVMEFVYHTIITITKVIGYTVGFLTYVYTNRGEYVKALNTVRNTIGSQFIYA